MAFYLLGEDLFFRWLSSDLQILGVNGCQHKQTRHLSIHEHYSMKLLQDAGILIPQGGVAKTPEQAYEIASTLGTYLLTVLNIAVLYPILVVYIAYMYSYW